MTIKLLALDLDGTLFADDLIISPRTRAAIASAQELGVLVTIATGRIFKISKRFALDLGIEAPLICYQGALVRHSVTDKTLLHKTVPIELTRAIVSEANSRHLQVNLYIDENIYVGKSSSHAEYYSQINMNEPLIEVGNLDQWLTAQKDAEPTKIVIVTDASRTDSIIDLFTGLYAGKLQVTKSHPRFTEFTNMECSKGKSLAYLAQVCGFTREEVMAIGDGHNDIDMIEWAGHGVAMCTGPQDLHNVARTICPALADDGAAVAIEQYILGVGGEVEHG
ncbi:MAG: Cof-type HAD-IIB family hydrolase [Chloroflexota bacterium]|nr:Cof-type HAD-IIB family hydrolase [Chloroflexota bacterium]